MNDTLRVDSLLDDLDEDVVFDGLPVAVATLVSERDAVEVADGGDGDRLPLVDFPLFVNDAVVEISCVKEAPETVLLAERESETVELTLSDGRAFDRLCDSDSLLVGSPLCEIDGVFCATANKSTNRMNSHSIVVVPREKECPL